jgi:hypothetical protein
MKHGNIILNAVLGVIEMVKSDALLRGCVHRII